MNIIDRAAIPFPAARIIRFPAQNLKITKCTVLIQFEDKIHENPAESSGAKSAAGCHWGMLEFETKQRNPNVYNPISVFFLELKQTQESDIITI
jgi:hypothetical protein